MRAYANYIQNQTADQMVFEAAKTADSVSILRYLKDGGDINLKNAQGHSLLMLAAYYGHVELCQALVQAGADVNSRDHFSNTILMGVSFKGHTQVAKLLIENGADINALNKGEQTALMYAQLFGRAEIVNLLSNNKTNISHIPFSERIIVGLKILAKGILVKIKGGYSHV